MKTKEEICKSYKNKCFACPEYTTCKDHKGKYDKERILWKEFCEKCNVDYDHCIYKSPNKCSGIQRRCDL